MLEVLLSLSIVKSPFGIKLFLNIIPLLIGVYYWVTQRKCSKFFWPLMLMLILGSTYSLLNSEYNSVLRLGQVICLVGFCDFFSKWINKEKLFKIADGILWISLVVIVLEVIFKGHMGMKRFIPGVFLPRYEGPVGESNFSGIAIAFAGIIFIYLKRYYRSALALVLVILCASRSGFITMGSALFFVTLSSLLSKKNFERILKVSLLSTVFIPLLIYSSNLIFDDSLKQYLDKLSSGRFFIFLSYVDMGLDQLWGVGFFKGKYFQLPYIEKYLPLIPGREIGLVNEQHNFFIQVFSELGIIGYCLLAWQFIKLTMIKIKDSYSLAVLTSLMIGLSFLNGITNALVYMSIGWLISERVDNES